MIVEIISIPDCPNHQPAVERVKALLTAEAILADVREVLVSDESEAKALRFIGSPSVRVNGKDVEPLAFARTGLSCRIYADGTGIPPESLLKVAIASAKKDEM